MNPATVVTFLTTLMLLQRTIARFNNQQIVKGGRDMRLSELRLLSLAKTFAFLLAFTGAAAPQSNNPPKKSRFDMPAAVASAVEDNRPGAEIDTLEVETEAGIRLYDIEFKAGRGEIEVAEDGTVMDIATVITMKDLPKPAMDAIEKAAAGARIKQLEKSEIRAEIRKNGDKGKIVKLGTPEYVYEAELVKGKQTGEIQVAPDGTIVEALRWGSSEK